jgi:protein ImuB
VTNTLRSGGAAPAVPGEVLPRRRARQLELRARPAPDMRARSLFDTRARPQELWLGVHLPRLVLEAVPEGAGGSGPRVIVELEQRLQRVRVANEAARDAGVQPGMSLAAALALAPGLAAQPRAQWRERAWLERLAVLALRFTPRVSLEPPDGVLLEVQGSLALFGGADALCGALAAQCRAAGMQAQLALAPTPLAALAAARAGADLRILERAHLMGQIGRLPLSVLRWPPATLARLASMGVRSIGEALRLPRTGFTRRFGTAAQQMLDRLTGLRAETRRNFNARARFRGRCEPGYELEHHAAVLAALTPLLLDLERFLLARQCGVTEVRCRLRHRALPASRCVLRLVSPEASGERLASLLSERLAALALPAPVIACELHSGPLIERTLASGALWQPGEHGAGVGAEQLTFIEDLRARLGVAGVYGLEVVAEHRPEAASRQVGEIADERAARRGAAHSAQGSPARRPLWLLRTPQALQSRAGQPQHAGALELLEGPERIETGWWDGQEVARDYYVARTVRGVRLWIFRERAAPHRWFLQGFFG